MKLCLGTVQLGMDYGVQGAHQPAYQKADEIMEYAVTHGITVFDCAPVYGEAEKVAGHYIRHHPDRTKDLQAVSKLPANAFDGVPKEKWRETVKQCAERSRNMLHVKRLRAYLFHDASMIWDPDAVKALDAARQEGIADTAGVSIYTPKEACRALEYGEIRAVQLPYNVFDQRLDQCGFFEQAKKQEVEIYARSTLLQGLVTMDEDQLPEYMQFAGKYLRRFHSICRKYSVTPLEAAAGYVRQHAGIDYIVFGADSLQQLKQYLSLHRKEIPSAMVAEIKKEFETVEERLVNPSLWK